MFNIYRALKTKKVLGFVIGTLVIIGLVGIVPRIAQADNPQEAPKFWGYAYDENGNIKPNTPIVVTNIADPTEQWTTQANANGYYEVHLCNGCQVKKYVINYGPPTPYFYGTGLVSPPRQVNIYPSQWEDFSEMTGY